jgi:Peptidase A4 family
MPSPQATASAIDTIVHCSGTASTGIGASVKRGSTWSGYVAAQAPDTVTCVEAAWIEPDVTCGAADAAVAIWVGIGGYTSHDLGIFDDGHALERAGTGVDCEGGQATHYAWHQIEPLEASDQPFGAVAGPAEDMVIAAGDRLWAQVQFGSGAYVMTVANLTSGDVRSISQSSTGKHRSSANWVVEGETGEWLARFPSVTFGDGASTIGGIVGTIGSAAWLRNEVDEWSGGFRRLSVSPMSADGSSFQVTWLHR